MRRLHLFEFNERPECPAFIRDSVTETLGTGLRWGRMGDIVGPELARFCRDAGVRRILDLCSGTGEPVRLLVEWLARHGEPVPEFVLSDLFPHHAAFAAARAAHPGVITTEDEPVSATAVPATIAHDARVIINSLHHFRPEVVAQILGDAVAARRAVFVYEGFPRNLARLAPTSPTMLPALLANPLLARRQRAAKALLTYVVPVIPAVAMWDACVSVLRVHSEAELRALVAPFGAGYAWSYREVPYPLGGRGVFFTGIPTGAAA
ncbi:MAG: hypothetical protein H6709_12150 [Kofleriaceae bacterium]|nr:hypothetical protein [Myxococcales bacterium]MCB9564780.1 hypothetical protein [Kofleriaceae bacterium]MCB9572829.1 hypothetical protein [Kofleriaceae bacterium]